jgi:small-conductance mechanosensitive channel
MLISGAGLVLWGEALAIAGYGNKIVTFVLIPAGGLAAILGIVAFSRNQRRRNVPPRVPSRRYVITFALAAGLAAVVVGFLGYVALSARIILGLVLGLQS